MRLSIVHQTEGRTRLRALARPVDAETLMGLADRMSQLAGVDDIDCRLTTGSLVIEHPDLTWDDLAVEVARVGGVIVSDAVPEAVRKDGLEAARTTVGRVDTLVSQLTAGGVDMRTLAFILMVGLALRQILRGQIMVPAMSFLWYASEILLKSSPASGDSVDAGSD